MLQLILKDFRANWMYQLLGLVVFFVIDMTVIALMLDDGGNIVIALYVIVMLLSCTMASLLFIVVDELYGADRIYASLPVTRGQIVQARHFTSLVQILLTLTLGILAAQVGAYFQEGFDDPAIKIIYHPMLWLLLLIILLLLNSFTYPFYFRFGLQKGLLLISTIQLLFIAVGYLLYWLFTTYEHMSDHFQRVLGWVSNQNDLVILAVFVSFFLIVLGGSIKLSGKFYKNKDI